MLKSCSRVEFFPCSKSGAPPLYGQRAALLCSIVARAGSPPGGLFLRLRFAGIFLRRGFGILLWRRSLFGRGGSFAALLGNRFFRDRGRGRRAQAVLHNGL